MDGGPNPSFDVQHIPQTDLNKADLTKIVKNTSRGTLLYYLFSKKKPFRQETEMGLTVTVCPFFFSELHGSIETNGDARETSSMFKYFKVADHDLAVKVWVYMHGGFVGTK